MSSAPKAAPRNKSGRPEDVTFGKLNQARALKGPPRGKQPWEYPHEEFSHIKLRVHPPTLEGHVRRQLVIRARYTVNGKAEEDRRPFLELDDLAKLNSQEALRRWQQGITDILDRVEEIEKLRRASPEEVQEATKASLRMTVGDAWKRHGVETRLQRQPTTDKEVSLYGTYYAHLADRYLDELTYKEFWSHYVTGLGQGKLLNADAVTWSKLPAKRAEATIIGIINLGAKLYSFARNADGLPGKPRDWNPALEARKLVGEPNKRTGSIPLSRVAEVWRAADTMCAPWARDQLRLYLLTGLRFALLSQLTFSEVDARQRVLRISPHKVGTKRRGSKTPANAPALVVPVAAAALRIIEARRQWAPDPEGPVWYAIGQPGGKARKAGAPEVAINVDPRSNWAHIEERVLDGMHFMRHDLRRTFSRIAVKAGADLLGTSLLMLHSPRTVAKVLNLPDITTDYMNLPEAQDQMRSASNSIEQFIKGLLDGSINVSHEPEPELPALLEEAVGFED